MVDYATDMRGLAGRLGPRALLLGGVLVAAWAAFTSSVGDPDFWWHIATGRWIVEHGALPSSDLFTYTVPGHAWTDHEYLTEILMWLIYSHGGFAAISLFFAVITWAAFLVLYRTADGGRRPYVVAGLGLALAALAGGPIWGPRAQMITFLFSAVELLLIRRYLEGRSRAINWFPLLMVLWANLHGGWVIGFAFLGVALASEAVQWILDRSNPAHFAHLKRLGLVTGLCVLAVLVTPHGPALYLYPFATQGSVAQQKLIVEWFSPDFHQAVMYPFLAMVLLTIAGFALRRPRLYDALLVLTTLALALHSVRHVALYVAAVTPILIVHWSEIWAEQSRLRGWRLQPAPPSGLMAVMTVIALVVIAGVTVTKVAGDLSRQTQATASDFPVAAADWIAAHPGEVGTHMYNQYGWGGYLIYRFYPDPTRKVFIFGEAELMGDDLLNRYQDVQTIRPDWSRVLDANHVDYVVYNRGEALDTVLAADSQWRRVYQDSLAVIYVRATR